MYIKTYFWLLRFAGPDRTRCMATYKCALRENGRTLFALVVSLKMRDLHSLVSQVELLLSPIGVAVFLHKPNARSPLKNSADLSNRGSGWCSLR